MSFAEETNLATYRLQIKPYIQPFERRLALLEIQSICGRSPSPARSVGEKDTAFSIETSLPRGELVNRLTYWEWVQHDLTRQTLREATVNAVRNGVPFRGIQRQLPFNVDVPLPNRRCLRYGTHGLHEYRGKFFPQLVRALINIGKVPDRGVVADPMCGSGTTLVEASLMDHTALGLDINPLSVLMSKAKCDVLGIQPEHLVRGYEGLRDRILSEKPHRTTEHARYLHSLPRQDQNYLGLWFAPQVLADLESIVGAIYEERAGAIRAFFLVALSNILRRVSWQKDDDLRVRREVTPDVDTDPVREFLEELGRSVRCVLAFLWQEHGVSLGKVHVEEGDARNMDVSWCSWRGKVDAIITSPPYATALPYLDTDRLSLIYLQLLTRSLHRKRDQVMIGNREVTERQRRDLWDRFGRDRQLLPMNVVTLVEKIRQRNAKTDAGFRRRNLPALLSKYFLDMTTVLAGMLEIMKAGAPAYVVVGSNHTVAGGERIEIPTAHLLEEIAKTLGFDVDEAIPMEMLVSRDIFRKNAGPSEHILCLRKPAQKYPHRFREFGTLSVHCAR